ncbi:MAG: hypothetical protein N4A40_00320 [Tissierellales bacterium]|jgi:hypothetical protein|nr:hypothetical protein [Tissierellales bacterium]
MRKLVIALMLSLVIISTGCSNGENKAKEQTSDNVKVETSAESQNEEEAKTKETPSEENEKIESLNVPFDQIYADPSILEGHVSGATENIDYSEVLKEPVTTVYFNKENPSDEDYGNYVSIYPIGNEDGTSLYLIFEKSKLREAKLDTFVGTVSQDLFETDYMFYSFESVLESQPKKEAFDYNYDDLKSIQETLEKKYLNQEIVSFNNDFEVYSPVSRILNVNNNKEVETYYLVDPDGYTLSTTISLVIEDNKITKIHVDDAGNRAFDIMSLAK